MTKILVKANDNKNTFISSFQEKIAERIVSIYDTGFPELFDVICTYGTYVIRICMNGMSSEFFCCCNIRVSQGEFFLIFYSYQ